MHLSLLHHLNLRGVPQIIVSSAYKKMTQKTHQCGANINAENANVKYEPSSNSCSV